MKITTIPQVYRNVNRWREILSILSKYGLANWVSRFDLAFAKGLLKNRNGEVLARHTRETRIRLAIEELGPVFIKLGQILSTRPDLVGAALAEQLRILQTDVPADPAEVVRATIERELGQSVERLFAEFDDQPLASASIGQVHHARLTSGAEVAVKIQHHDIRDRVRVDMDILAGLAQLAERIPELVNYRPSSTVAEFQRALRRELDFTREARNLEEIAHRFAGRPEVHIPRVDAELSTSRVLTMEFLHGAKVADAQRMDRAPFDSGPCRAAVRGNLSGNDLSGRFLPRRSASRQSGRHGGRRRRAARLRHGRAARRTAARRHRRDAAGQLSARIRNS